jgi:hypothetical protein
LGDAIFNGAAGLVQDNWDSLADGEGLPRNYAYQGVPFAFEWLPFIGVAEKR